MRAIGAGFGEPGELKAPADACDVHRGRPVVQVVQDGGAEARLHTARLAQTIPRQPFPGLQESALAPAPTGSGLRAETTACILLPGAEYPLGIQRQSPSMPPMN